MVFVRSLRVEIEDTVNISILRPLAAESFIVTFALATALKRSKMRCPYAALSGSHISKVLTSYTLWVLAARGLKSLPSPTKYRLIRSRVVWL